MCLVNCGLIVLQNDMFVIVDSYDSISSKLDLKERFATALSRAGTSVTVTSITNSIAFFLGATSLLPAVKAFCIYAGFGIIFDYCFQVNIRARCL